MDSLFSLDKEKDFSIFIVKFVREHNYEIWKSHQDKLPTTKTIENLKLRWDTLGKSWSNNEILGCIIPNIAGNIVWTPSQDLGGTKHFVKTVQRERVHVVHFSVEVTHVEWSYFSGEGDYSLLLLLILVI